MTSQINLKMPERLLIAAKTYADNHGYRNIQEFIYQSVRDKVFESEFDESFSEREIGLIDEILETSLKKKQILSERDLRKALSE